MSSEINRLLRLLLLAILLYAGNIAAQSGKADTAFINNLNVESFAVLKENPDTAAWLARKAIELSTPVNYLQGWPLHNSLKNTSIFLLMSLITIYGYTSTNF